MEYFSIREHVEIGKVGIFFYNRAEISIVGIVFYKRACRDRHSWNSFL